MTQNPKLNPKPAVVAAAAATFLMFIFGLAFRLLAAQLAADVDKAPINPAALQQFPIQLNDWTGQDVLMDEYIVRMTDTDAHIKRRYSRRGGLESVMLYVGSGVKARDLMPHRPEVCYIGAGWTLKDRRSVELPLSNGIKLPCNILQFSRGYLSKEKVVVLDYYLVDGQYCRDISLLRLKVWRGSGAVGYVAQVQIATSIVASQTAHSARTTVSEFAVESALPLADLFKGIDVTGRSDMAPSDANSMYAEEMND